MQSDRLKLAVIIGSTREGRLGATVGRWFAGVAEQDSRFAVDPIDLAALALPPVHPERPTPAIRAFLARLDAADAFVVVTPEYNHSYPASLKHAIDQGLAEWAAKPVGFVSYGGLAGGLRAVEHLRLVFAELQAVTMRTGVSFQNVWDCFEAGLPVDPHRPARAARAMLDQLAWWAHALRTARAQTPLAKAAAE